MDDISDCECPGGDAPTTTIDATRAVSIVQLPTAHGESVVWQASFVPTEVRWLPSSSSSPSLSSPSSSPSSSPTESSLSSSPSETLPLVTINADDDFKDSSDHTDGGGDQNIDNSNEMENDEGSGLSMGAKAGIGVGVTLAVLFILGVAFLLFRRKRRRAAAEVKTGPDIQTAPPIGPAHPSGTPSELEGNTARPWSLRSELDGASIAKVAEGGNRGPWSRSELDAGGVSGEKTAKPVTELPV